MARVMLSDDIEIDKVLLRKRKELGHDLSDDEQRHAIHQSQVKSLIDTFAMFLLREVDFEKDFPIFLKILRREMRWDIQFEIRGMDG